MIAEHISPDDPRWTQFLSKAPHDVYHLPEYVALEARYEEGEGNPIAFYAEDSQGSFLAPMITRPVPEFVKVVVGVTDWQDAISPYGYSPPLSTLSGASLDVRPFLQAFCELAASQEIVAVLFRLHPLLGVPPELLAGYGQLVQHGQTVSVDLTLPDEEQWRQTRENHRRGIKKLTRAGFSAEMDRWDLFDDFVTIYWETMSRLEADKRYLFEREYFDDLRTALGSGLHLCTIASPEGDVAGAGLFTVVDGIVQYHLGATSSEYLRDSPTKLMFDHVRRWAAEAGNRVLHLGGGVGGRTDSLFHFKAGFSPRRHDFYTFRMVLDESKYAELNRLWRDQHGEPELEPDEDDSYFPLYRRPVRG